MTFNEIKSTVAGRLNLTSTDALTRIGDEINDRYARITSSIGLITSRRVTIPATTVIGDRNLTFNGLEKILAIYDNTSGQDRTLEEDTFDTMRNTLVSSGTLAYRYAIARMGARTVTVILDVTPSTAFTLRADGYEFAPTLAGDMSPSFSESFHDILIHGVMADELRKKEKYELAKDRETQYEERLADLRYFIHKSAYLDIMQHGGQMRDPVERRWPWWRN